MSDWADRFIKEVVYPEIKPVFCDYSRGILNTYEGWRNSIFYTDSMVFDYIRLDVYLKTSK